MQHLSIDSVCCVVNATIIRIIIFLTLRKSSTLRSPGCLSPLSDSPATLESSLSPAELVPFQGCVIPPLTPQWDLSTEDSLVCSSTEAGDPSAQDGALWKGIAQCQGRALGDSMGVNNVVNFYGDI